MARTKRTIGFIALIWLLVAACAASPGAGPEHATDGPSVSASAAPPTTKQWLPAFDECVVQAPVVWTEDFQPPRSLQLPTGFAMYRDNTTGEFALPTNQTGAVDPAKVKCSPPPSNPPDVPDQVSICGNLYGIVLTDDWSEKLPVGLVPANNVVKVVGEAYNGDGSESVDVAGGSVLIDGQPVVFNLQTPEFALRRAACPSARGSTEHNAQASEATGFGSAVVPTGARGQSRPTS
jgi:hypothetical protein